MRDAPAPAAGAPWCARCASAPAPTRPGLLAGGDADARALAHGAIALCAQQPDRAGWVVPTIAEQFPAALSLQEDGVGWALLPAREADDAGRATAAAAHRVAARLGVRTAVGLSPFVAGPDRLHDALRQARIVLELARGGQVDVEEATTGTWRLLLGVAVTDPDELAACVATSIGPAVEHDARLRTELVDTFRAYLEHGANMNATAAAIYAHRHTVAARLERLGALTRLDPLRHSTASASGSASRLARSCWAPSGASSPRGWAGSRGAARGLCGDAAARPRRREGRRGGVSSTRGARPRWAPRLSCASPPSRRSPWPRWATPPPAGRGRARALLEDLPRAPVEPETLVARARRLGVDLTGGAVALRVAARSAHGVRATAMVHDVAPGGLVLRRGDEVDALLAGDPGGAEERARAVAERLSSLAAVGFSAHEPAAGRLHAALREADVALALVRAGEASLADAAAGAWQLLVRLAVADPAADDRERLGLGVKARLVLDALGRRYGRRLGHPGREAGRCTTT